MQAFRALVNARRTLVLTGPLSIPDRVQHRSGLHIRVQLSVINRRVASLCTSVTSVSCELIVLSLVSEVVKRLVQDAMLLVLVDYLGAGLDSTEFSLTPRS